MVLLSCIAVVVVFSSSVAGSSVQGGLISQSDCQALTYPSLFKHGYCFFMTGKTGDCVKDSNANNQARCNSIYSGAHLMVLPDDSKLPDVGVALEPLECGSYPWIEVGLTQDASPAGIHDDWNWILPDGSKLLMGASWMSAMWATSGDGANTAQHRMCWSDQNGGFGDVTNTNTFLAYCMARAVTLSFSSIANKEGTSQIIGTDQDVENVLHCVAKCHRIWHCVAFTYITTTPMRFGRQKRGSYNYSEMQTYGTVKAEEVKLQQLNRQKLTNAVCTGLDSLTRDMRSVQLPTLVSGMWTCRRKAVRKYHHMNTAELIQRTVVKICSIKIVLLCIRPYTACFSKYDCFTFVTLLLCM